MLERAFPTEFSRPATSGRNKPAFLVCDTKHGDSVEVVAKFSHPCDEGVTNLAREVIAACLAGDLGLPVPQPFLLDIRPEWVASITNEAAKSAIQSSVPVAFGSKVAGPQFSVWNSGSNLRSGMIPIALGVFAFDAIIQNPDRRADNPNCLIRGDALRIFDHELAFSHEFVLRWTPPWVLGGLQVFEKPGFHIFRRQLRKEALDFEGLKEAWEQITDSRLKQYKAEIPVEWASAKPAVASALNLIRDARDNIDACLTEIKRVLT